MDGNADTSEQSSFNRVFYGQLYRIGGSETSDVSHFVEMSGSDPNDISSGNYNLSTVSTECQGEFLKAIQDNTSHLFAEFSFVMSHTSIDGA